MSPHSATQLAGPLAFTEGVDAYENTKHAVRKVGKSQWSLTDRWEDGACVWKAISRESLSKEYNKAGEVGYMEQKHRWKISPPEPALSSPAEVAGRFRVFLTVRVHAGHVGTLAALLGRLDLAWVHQVVLCVGDHQLYVDCR